MKHNALRRALEAAMRRVGIYSCLDARAFEAELQSQLSIIPISNTGRIIWRRFELGQRLLDCLGEAQNWRCCYCSSSLSHAHRSRLPRAIRLTFEHVVSLSTGGRDHPDNMVVACCDCNQGRGNLPVDTFLQRLTSSS